jgi:hypothetical protein
MAPRAAALKATPSADCCSPESPAHAAFMSFKKALIIYPFLFI